VFDAIVGEAMRDEEELARTFVDSEGAWRHPTCRKSEGAPLQLLRCTQMSWRVMRRG